MNIVCVICNELLAPSNDIFHTSCGHIFHYVCLMQWLERSKTCPQCRKKTKEAQIHRIYFSFSNNDSTMEDTTSRLDKINNWIFQLELKAKNFSDFREVNEKLEKKTADLRQKLREVKSEINSKNTTIYVLWDQIKYYQELKDKNISNLTEANEKLKKKMADLRQEVRKVESDINIKNTMISILKDQIKGYQLKCSDIEGYARENECLKESLKNLKKEHFDRVTKMKDMFFNILGEAAIMKSDIFTKLKPHIAVLERELSVISEKSKEIEDEYKKLHLEYTRTSTENKILFEERIKRKELEEQLMNCESEKIALRTQLLDIQGTQNVRKCICKTSEISLENQDSLTVEHNRKSDMAINDSVTELGNTLKLEKDNSCISKPVYPKTASGSGMSFDDFGGHAKYDKFPSPIHNSYIKKVKEAVKTKELTLDTDFLSSSGSIKWNVERIIAVHPGQDQVVRVAIVKTFTGSVRITAMKIPKQNGVIMTSK